MNHTRIYEITENSGANFVLRVNGTEIAYSTHPEPLIEFVQKLNQKARPHHVGTTRHPSTQPNR